MDDLVLEAQKAVLKIHASKIKEIRLNSQTQENLLIEERVVKSVDKFCYLGNMVTQDRGPEDVKSRIRKA